MHSECTEHREKIAALILGDLDDREKQDLEAHLAACARCLAEYEGYSKTINQLQSIGNEEVPRHFFIYPEERASSPWRLFRQLPVGWRSALACAALLILSLGIAAISRLQIRSDSTGWAISFGGKYIDEAALTKKILEAADRQSQQSQASWVRAIQNEIAQSRHDLTGQQQYELEKALAQMDLRIGGRIKSSEGQVREDTQVLVSNLYRVISRQRAQDLEAINLRFDSTDATNAVKARQTNEILGTLLQVADLKLR